MGIWPGWWENPEASATLAVALVAGLFAVYQLRALPAERKRRILDQMVAKWALSKDDRGAVLRESPPLMLLAHKQICEAIDTPQEPISSTDELTQDERRALVETREKTKTRLRDEARIWERESLGVSFTAAHEVLASEFKFRALLWSIEQVRNTSDDSLVRETDRQSAVSAVESLNDFGADYENGAYPPRTLFGLTHRGMAAACKALEPYIWARSLNGRWGRRVIRLGLAAQHFNDVTEIHRSNSLVWTNRYSERSEMGSGPTTMVVHPALTKSIFGREMLDAESLMSPRFLPLVRLRSRSVYWSGVGKLNLQPRFWFSSYGGLRMRRHGRKEADLAAMLRYVLSEKANGEVPASLAFDWSMTSVEREMKEAAEALRRPGPRSGLSWLYLPRPTGSGSGRNA